MATLEVNELNCTQIWYVLCLGLYREHVFGSIKSRLKFMGLSNARGVVLGLFDKHDYT